MVDAVLQVKIAIWLEAVLAVKGLQMRLGTDADGLHSPETLHLRNCLSHQSVASARAAHPLDGRHTANAWFGKCQAGGQQAGVGKQPGAFACVWRSAEQVQAGGISTVHVLEHAGLFDHEHR